MSVLRRLAAELRSDQPAVQWPASSGQWLDGMVWQGWGGGAVSAEQSMRLSAVFACLRLLSEAVSTLPLDTFEVDGPAREPVRPMPEYLRFEAPQSTRIEYLSQVMLSLLTSGDAFVLTPRDGLGVPLDLVPLDPSKVNVSRGRDGRARYECEAPGGSSVQLDPTFDIMHIRGMMLPGRLCGLSPIGYASETVGLGLAAQRFGKAFFDNGALPGAVIEAPGDMAPETAKMFRDTWNESHQGGGNAHKVGVLTKGAKLSKVTINPDEAQFLETRQFQVPDVARIFGVPPHLIADASNSTSWGSGLAEQNIAFAQFSLNPWIARIEEAHSRLLTTHGMPDAFVKLNTDASLRASTKDRYEAHAVGIEAGFLTVNEARELEDLPPVETQTNSSMESLTSQLQQIYLAVGTVITADEAREILNRNGAGLTGPGPSKETPDV